VLVADLNLDAEVDQERAAPKLNFRDEAEMSALSAVVPIVPEEKNLLVPATAESAR